MAENVHSDIIINVDTSVGIAQIKNLQKQISSLNAQLLKSGAAQARAAENVQRNLINNINATGKFAASVQSISSTTETFTNRLEKNKFSMGEYFRYAGGASKTFGKLFRNEFDTIEKVARERVKTLQTQYTKLSRSANGSLQAIAVRPLSLDMANLGTQTAMAAQKQQIFNQLIKQGSTNLLNFGKNTQWAGRQLMVGFSIPLAYIGTLAAKTFMQMEEQAIRFKRVYGDSFTASSETDKMVAQIKDLAKEFTKYGVAVEKTMKMAADAAAMGKMGSDLLAQVGQATRLAVLGGVEQDQALQTTISLTNAFGLAAEKLTGKIDFLNAVENQTVTSIEDLTIAIPKAGPVIQQLGGDVEDLAFFLTAMREGGINASEGANALKSGLASLINPSGKAAEMLKGLGVNINEIVEANKGNVTGIVIEFSKALDTLDPLNRSRAIEQLFGKFQFARLSTLFQNVIQQGTQAERVLKLSSSTMEELAVLSERELKRIEESPMYKFKKSVEDLKVSLVPLGEAFLKAVTPIVEFVKGFLDRFNEMSDGAKQFAVLITTVVAGIGPVLLMTFGLIANGAANIIKLFAALKNMFSGVGNTSQMLGSQTEYLTQQQLEASAVAASLDQNHSKLIQTFTSETGAVNNLAAAYARAVVAQSKLLGVPMTGGGGAATGNPIKKKYASGVVSVPGPKGAGDVVPAMLSPGEAVIPSKMADRYSGLISGMIDGKIPGYYNGTDDVGNTRKRNLRFPDSYGLQASHLSPGTDLLEPNRAKAIMNKEIDNLIRQGVISESMVDRSLISKISKSVKLNSQTVGMLSGTFNQWFTSEKSVKDLSSIVRDLSKTKGMVGAGLIPNLDYLSSNNMAQSVKDSTTSKYLKDLDKTFRSMIANSGAKELSESQLQSIFKKAQRAAEQKIVDFGEKASIRKANIFGRSTLSPVLPGTGKAGRTNLQTPFIGYSDAQKLTRSSSNRAKVSKLSGVIDKWMPTNSKYITASESQTARIKNLLKTLPVEESKSLVKALISSDGSPKALDEIVKQVVSGKKVVVPAANKATPKSIIKSSPKGSQTFNLSDILGPQAKNLSSGKAGLIAKLFGRKYQSGTGSVRPFSRAGILSSMLSRSNVAVRMKNEDFFSALASGGKNARYESAFSTGTGADYMNKRGSVNKKQKLARSAMERDLFGLDTKTTPASARPTYGYARTSILQSLINSLLGTSGKNFNAVTSNTRNKSMDLYGDIDLVTKSSVAKRSSAYPGDTLIDYVRAIEGRSSRYPNFNIPAKNLKMSTTPMRGASQSDMLAFERFGSPFGANKSSGSNSYWTNPKSPYIETQTPGGFAFKEIEKIIAGNPAIAKQLRAELKAAGLGSVRVSGPGFISSLFKKMGIPGYNDGVVSVPGAKGAGDVVPAMLSPGEAVIPTKMAQKYSPLINSMIKGNVPGFEDGRVGAGKMAATTGIASMGAMMYGMSGMPGADVAGQIGMPLMMLSMVLPMIASKTGMVATGLLAVAGAITYLIIQSNEATKAGLKMGKSMAMTNKKLEEFAALNGVVTSSQEADKAREIQLTGESGKKRIYGQNFLESEAGKLLLSDSESMTKSGKTNQEIAENFSSQLSYAVLQGSVTQEQAASIAAALGEKLQDYSISTNIVGNLTALYGRNGENLLTDPLSISLKIQEQASAQQTRAYENAIGTEQRNVGISGGNLGVIAGGALMTAAGAVMTATGVLAPLGVLLAAGGVTAMSGGGLLELAADAKESNEARGIAVQLGAEQVAQNQGLLDSLTDRYNTEIKELEAKKEIAKNDKERKDLEEQITQKVKERDSSISKQKAANKQIFDSLLGQAQSMGAAFNDSIGLAIDERFKDATGGLKAAAQLAKDALASLPNEKNGKLNTFKATLQLGLASGEFDPVTATNLINAAAKDGSIETNFNLIASAQGTAEANQLLQLIGKAGVSSKNYGVILDYINKNPQSFKEDQEALAQIANMQSEYGIKINLDVNGENKIKGVREFLQATGGLKGKPVTREIVTNFIANNPGMDADQKANLQEMLANWDILSGGDNKLSYQVMVDYVIGKANDAAIWAYYLSKNPMTADRAAQVQVELMPVARAEFFADGQDLPGSDSNSDSEITDNAGSARADILDDLLKRLQNVRKASVNVNGGITELMSLLKTGKNFTGFNGIEQQLNLKGYSEEFIRFMADASKADQKRFMTIDDGVVKLKESGKAVQNLFSAVTLGNFERSVRESIGAISRELDARKTLVDITKMSYNEAAEAAKDAGLAEAIAAIKSNTAIKNKNKAIRDTINLYKEEKAALESAKTVQEQFDDIYNAQIEVISSKQAVIDVAFNIETDSFSDAMSAAQADIDKKVGAAGGLDDLQAGLQLITWQEDTINKKYDERLEALDKIERANEKILNQQKAQLGIADALSRGDISAAASAVQALRSSDAKSSFQNERDLLERFREGELGTITANVNGIKKTRKEIEEDILRIEKEIFAIEEDRLEPAREAIRLATVARDIKLDALDDEKLKWDELKAKIDLSTASASAYLATLAQAAALLKELTAQKTNVPQSSSLPAGTITDASGFAGIFPQKNTSPSKGMYNPLTGAVTYRNKGGMISPKYFASGGFARGSDVIPAMLTPGEFVVSKFAVEDFGVDRLRAINNGSYSSDSVYNYELNINVKSDADANDIARTVMSQIKQIDSQRIRGNRL